MLAQGTRTGTAWSPCSPDLSPVDYFFWSEVKRMVYKFPLPTTLLELKDKISHVMRRLIQPNIIANAVMNMQKRAQLVLQKNGGHIPM